MLGGGYGVLKTPLGQAERRAKPKRGPEVARAGSPRVRIRRRDAPYAHPLRRTRREGTGEAGAD
jgi:hypothetical protein